MICSDESGKSGKVLIGPECEREKKKVKDKFDVAMKRGFFFFLFEV
jgi:hypothetical protein